MKNVNVRIQKQPQS